MQANCSVAKTCRNLGTLALSACLYDSNVISGRTAVGGVVAAGLLYFWYDKIPLFPMRNRLFGVIRNSPGAIKTFVNNYPITSSAVAISAAYATYSYTNGLKSMGLTRNITLDTISTSIYPMFVGGLFHFCEVLYRQPSRVFFRILFDSLFGKIPGAAGGM